MTPDLSVFLQGWYEKVELRQEAKSRVFDLPYSDFIGLFSKKQLAALEAHMADGSIWARQNRDNPYALVVSWKSFAASKTGLMNKETAQVCARWKSRMDCSMNKGDQHTPESRARISKSKTGHSHEEATKDKISASMKGVNLGRKDKPETTVKRGEGQKARWARYHAEKAARDAGQHP